AANAPAVTSDYLSSINSAVNNLFSYPPHNHIPIIETTRRFRSIMTITDGIPCLANGAGCNANNPNDKDAMQDHLRDLRQTLLGYDGTLEFEHIFFVIVNTPFMDGGTHRLGAYWNNVLGRGGDTIFLRRTEEIRSTLITTAGTMLRDLNMVTGRPGFQCTNFPHPTQGTAITLDVDPLTDRIRIITTYDPQVVTSNVLTVYRPYTAHPIQPSLDPYVTVRNFPGPRGYGNATTITQYWEITHPEPGPWTIGTVYQTTSSASVHVVADYVDMAITDHNGIPIQQGRFFQYQEVEVAAQFSSQVLPQQLIGYEPQLAVTRDQVSLDPIPLSGGPILYTGHLMTQAPGIYHLEFQLMNNNTGTLASLPCAYNPPPAIQVEPVRIALTCEHPQASHYPGDPIEWQLSIRPAENPAEVLSHTAFPDINWFNKTVISPNDYPVQMIPVHPPATYRLTIQQAPEVLPVNERQGELSQYNLWVTPQFNNAIIGVQPAYCPFTVQPVHLNYNAGPALHYGQPLTITLEVAPEDSLWVKSHRAEITLTGDLYDTLGSPIACDIITQPIERGQNMMGFDVTLDGCNLPAPTAGTGYTLAVQIRRNGLNLILENPLLIHPVIYPAQP
ncbi:MAG: hypothetical protein K8S97_09785, partial [Anaerolineae bacterium]|nr:hypothetical protein [Anaerolineae bacterium]